MEGSVRFGMWHVYIRWEENNRVDRVRFVKTAVPGPVPVPLTRYLAGKSMDLSPLYPLHQNDEGIFGEVYRHVADIPYGETRTYAQIADLVETAPRVVGMAMKRNMTPLLIPCHRVVASGGIGGFTPDVSIKRDLLEMEERVYNKMRRVSPPSPEK